MARQNALNLIHIERPCDLDWDSLPGDGPSRVCPACGKAVHNLSAMPREEAEQIAGNGAEPRCVYYVRDATGGVRTLDYAPRSPRAGRARAWVALASLLALAAGGWQFLFFRSRPPMTRMAGAMPVRPLTARSTGGIAPAPTVPPSPNCATQPADPTGE